MNRVYGCIDLKSFYASVECAERGLDPFKTNLVVADPDRGKGSVCLAITPAMKSLGIKNRCRVFEIPPSVKYITAKPRMKLYMKYSADIYGIYLKYVSKEDIHVYSIDECFFDFTDYVKLYNLSAKELARKIMTDVLSSTKIPSSAGIGSNLFLAKVALDILAKKSPDSIACLNEETFKKTLWHHRPLSDFWNIGRGIEKRLNRLAIYDLFDLASADEKVLFDEFGKNAQFLIDHAKGIEPCTISEIHAYTAKSRSLSNGQILFEDYSFDDALIVVEEMVDSFIRELISKKMMAKGVFLKISYSKDIIKPTGKSMLFKSHTDSVERLKNAFLAIFLSTTEKNFPIRKINIGFCDVSSNSCQQKSFFDEVDVKEKSKQEAIISIQKKYGKNSITQAISLKDKSTLKKRNTLVGGHNAE